MSHCSIDTVLAMLMRMSVLAAYTYVHHLHSWYSRPQDGFGFPGDKVTDVCVGNGT